MSLVLETPPSAIITAAEAKSHLRIRHDRDDTYINSLIAAATYHVDGPDGALGRCLGEQTWVWTIDGFPCDNGRLRIPMPPTISIDEIVYDNTSNVETAYTGFRALHAASTSGAYVLPAIDGEYPETNGEPGCVRVTFTAGFDPLPADIKHAILLLVSHWNEHREAAVDTGAKFGLLDLPFGVQALLAKHVFRHPTS